MNKPDHLKPLIYDRTKADIEEAREIKAKIRVRGGYLTYDEQLKWDAGLRGAFNISDLNRMEDWVEFLGQMLNAYGYTPDLSPKKVWSANDVAIYKEDVDRLRKNIVALKDAFYTGPEWQNISFANTINMEQANAMEWDLRLCYEWLQGMVGTFPHAGQENTASDLMWFFLSGDSIPDRPDPPEPPPEPEVEYTVTFYGQGGVPSVSTRRTVNKQLQSVPTVTRDGHKFDGWYTGNGTLVTPGMIFYQDTAVYARWTEVIIPDPEPEPGEYDAVFSNNTWENIIDACKKKKVPGTWKAGDTKPMTIGGTAYQIRILGKNHDDYADGTGKAPLSFAFAQQWKEDLPMDPASVSTWSDSSIRTTVNGEILNSMPSIVRSAIKGVTKKTGEAGSSSLYNTIDKVWLLAEKELFGDRAGYSKDGYSSDEECAVLTQYEVFRNGQSQAVDRKYYWERSPQANYAGAFCVVSGSGTMENAMTGDKKGVVVGFCF